MTDPSIRFLRAARGHRRSLPEIAAEAQIDLIEAAAILGRGMAAGRLRLHDEDRQDQWVEVIDPQKGAHDAAA